MQTRDPLPDMLIDITQQTNTQLLLDASEKRFRRLLDGSIEGILIHRDFKALFVNQSFFTMLGYASYRDIIALDSLVSIVAPHDRERMAGNAELRINGEFVPEVYEFDALHCDGSIRCLELKSSIIEWEKQPALLSTVFDITERKLMQQEVEQQRQVLAHSNRLNILGEMVAGIAHELNQPLSAIASHCCAAKNRLASDQSDIKKMGAALDSIEEQALRSGEIIKQLRLLVAPKEPQYQKIDVASLLSTCLNIINFDGVINSKTISTDIAASLPMVEGNPVQIQQVLINLIRNASDAMQHLASNDRQLTLSAVQADERTVQVSVSDVGQGISKQQEAHLFESFFTSKADGMGMGLPICHKIIDAHKGKLWFTHNLRQGVTFHFTLPLFIG